MLRLTADDGIESVLGISRTRWLRERIAELLADYGQLEFPLGTGFIHGDVCSGNLLWNDRVDGSVVLGDWDSVSVDPREIDLAPTFAAARFGAAQETLDHFAASYGYDLRTWTGYHTLLQIRDISTLSALIKLAPRDPGSASQLSYRLASLEDDDQTVIWQAQ
jgi:aminoglycoside phosphotransferase (APT) family kinase protein